MVFFAQEPEQYERPSTADVPATPELMKACSEAVQFFTETAAGVFVNGFDPGVAAGETVIRATSEGWSGRAV